MTKGGTIDEPARSAPGGGRESCAACWRRTVATQRASLTASAHWLARAALMPAGQMPGLPDRPEFALCRAVPDCDDLECEAPLRREPEACAGLTAGLAEFFLSAVPGDASWQAALLSASLRRAGQTGHVPEAADPRLGPAALHAAVVANNLVRAAWSGLEPPPSVRGGNTTRASEPSLRSLELLLHPVDPETHPAGEGSSADRVYFPRTARLRPPGGADLLAIEFLNLGLERLTEIEGSRGRPAVGPAPLAWWKRLLRSLGLWPDPDAVLRRVAAGSRATFQIPAGDRETRRRFAHCDLLGQAATGFASIPLADTARAALLLKNLRRSPDADLVMPRLCRSLVAARCPQDMGWLAALGVRLLEDDPDSAGAEVSSFLLVDLIASRRGAAMDGSLERSSLWATLGAEGVDAEKPGGPHWIVRLCRRAAALQANAPGASRLERRMIDRMITVVATLWARPTWDVPEWQRLLLQCLEIFLGVEGHQEPIPAGAGCGLAGLAAHALRIREGLEQKGEDAPPALRELAGKVCQHPRFPFWGREAAPVNKSEATRAGVFDQFFFSNLGAASARAPGAGAAPPVQAPAATTSSGASAQAARPTGKGKKNKKH